MPNQKRVSKSERRIIRKKEKSLVQLQANEQFFKRLGVNKKIPRNVDISDLRKIPRHLKIDSYKETLFTWSFLNADREDEWSWGEKRDWSTDEYQKYIFNHLNSLIGNTWSEIENQTYNGAENKRKKTHTYQSVDTIVNEAINRWMDLEPFSEYETSFKCRIQSLVRLWGIREVSTFYLLWLDRQHQICPVD